MQADILLYDQGGTGPVLERDAKPPEFFRMVVLGIGEAYELQRLLRVLRIVLSCVAHVQFPGQ